MCSCDILDENGIAITKVGTKSRAWDVPDVRCGMPGGEYIHMGLIRQAPNKYQRFFIRLGRGETAMQIMWLKFRRWINECRG